MNINALVIRGSDPGAVPGDSTNTLLIWQRWGRNRIDERLKGFALFRWVTTVIGTKLYSCKWQPCSGYGFGCV